MLSTEIANILNAQHLGPESEINAVVFDSRQVLEGNQILFTAIKTPSNDGHRYIPELIEKGLRVFMVELEYQIPQAFLTTHTWIRVKDVLHHLHVWAEWKRNQFKGLCIAIAGSQGKTMVKGRVGYRSWAWDMPNTDRKHPNMSFAKFPDRTCPSPARMACFLY